MGAEPLASARADGGGKRMTSSTVTVPLRLRRGALRSRPAETTERWVRRRVGIAWALLVVDVLPFSARTWTGAPLVIPDPFGGGQADRAGCPARGTARRAERESSAPGAAERVPVPDEPAHHRVIPADPGTPAHRHHLPHLPVRRVRGHALAAHAMVGPARPAARPLPPDRALDRARHGTARYPDHQHHRPSARAGWAAHSGPFLRRRSRTSRRSPPGWWSCSGSAACCPAG